MTHPSPHEPGCAYSLQKGNHDEPAGFLQILFALCLVTSGVLSAWVRNEEDYGAEPASGFPATETGGWCLSTTAARIILTR